MGTTLISDTNHKRYMIPLHVHRMSPYYYLHVAVWNKRRQVAVAINTCNSAQWDVEDGTPVPTPSMFCWYYNQNKYMGSTHRPGYESKWAPVVREYVLSTLTTRAPTWQELSHTWLWLNTYTAPITRYKLLTTG